MEVHSTPRPDAKPAEDRWGRRDNLALLHQGFLTGIARLQARRQELGDPDGFRQRMRTALLDVRREATSLGYSNEDIESAEFATVAFLDEIILTSNEPGRDQWAKHPFAVELYNESAAGEAFFERLDELKTRRNSPQLADLLEVYVTCLLLGFEGKHTGAKGEIHAAIDWVRRRIDTIRQPESRLTPEALPASQAKPRPVPQAEPLTPPLLAEWKRVTLVLLGSALLLYILLRLNLNSHVNEILTLVRG